MRRILPLNPPPLIKEGEEKERGRLRGAQPLFPELPPLLKGEGDKGGEVKI
jgi:hypothetical protein